MDQDQNDTFLGKVTISEMFYNLMIFDDSPTFSNFGNGFAW